MLIYAQYAFSDILQQNEITKKQNHTLIDIVMVKNIISFFFNPNQYKMKP